MQASREIQIIRLLRCKKYNLKQIFERLRYDVVALYGFGLQGREFAGWLLDSNINICFCFDKDLSVTSSDIQILHKYSDIHILPDVFIITTHFWIDEIENELKNRYNNTDVISFRELAEELLLLENLNGEKNEFFV